MKPLKLVLIVMGALLLAFGLSGYALAFHEGGVAYCEGCHTMHNSINGETVAPAEAAHLLKGADVSSTCLGCHAGTGSYHVKSDDGSNFKPGGDFYWLTKSYSWTGHGDTSSPGESHGHSIVAADYPFLVADQTLTEAPGASKLPTPYKNTWLGCASCHDPHGKTRRQGQVKVSGSYGDPGNLVGDEIIGNYRLLGDKFYDGAQENYIFEYDSPIAVAPSNTTISSESDGNHVDYGSGMSEWCANCHPDFLSANAAAPDLNQHVHPVGNDRKLVGPLNIDQNYIMYVKTGDLSGQAATSYLQFVRFERGIDRTNINNLDPTSTQGPGANANVMCLSCHRAHASAFKYAGAWDFGAEFIPESHPDPNDTGLGANDVANSYYGRRDDFGSGQRSFCNKCHIKD